MSVYHFNDRLLNWHFVSEPFITLKVWWGMRKAFCIVALCFFVVFALVSCKPEPGEPVLPKYLIKGAVDIPSNSGLSGNDFFIRIMDGDKVVCTERVNADGSFSVEDLENSKTYDVFLSTIAFGEVVNESRSSVSAYGCWIRNVAPTKDHQKSLGIVTVKPLGTIRGVVKKEGETSNEDIMVFIPGTSFVAMTNTDGAFSIFNVPQSVSPVSLKCKSVTGNFMTETITGITLFSSDENESPVRTVDEVQLLRNEGSLTGYVEKANSNNHSSIEISVANSSRVYVGVTDVNGCFLISGIVPGTYVVSITADHFIGKTIDIVFSGIEQKTIGEQVLNAKGGTITGSICFSGDLSKSDVQINALSTDGKFCYSTITDSDGLFTITDVFPGCYSIAAVKNGYSGEMANINVSVNHTTEISSIQMNQYFQVDNNGVLAPVDKSNIPSALIIPSSLDGIAVVSIAADAFKDCSNITSLVISDGIQRIGENAFWYCTNITSLSLPSSLTEIGESSFRGLEKLKYLTIPGSLIDLPLQSFSLCHNLESIVIEEGVERIGAYALEEAFNALEYVEIPNSVTAIEGYAFRKCNFEEIHFNGTKAEWNAIYLDETWNDGNCAERVICTDGSIPLKETDGYFSITNNGTLFCSDISELPSVFEIPSIVGTISVNSLSSELFKGASFSSVVVPEGVTFIGDYCFANCSELESVSLPSTLTTISHYAFSYCPKLETITIPDGVIDLHGGSFFECTSLSTVRLPNTLTYLSGQSFGGCTSLNTITIPASVTDIHWNAFEGAGLTSLDIPNSVLNLRPEAFINCSYLETISISGLISEIPESIFKNCVSLETIEFKGTIAQWNALEKGENWNQDTPASLIHCSDGEIAL